LTACINFKNAAPYLAEWVEFHLLVGFEHFYLYNNNSEDDYQSALEPYVRAGLVTLIEWPQKPALPKSYEDCVAKHKHEARWIAFLDDDEFLFPTERADVRKVLKAYERYPGVAVHWLLFGSSHFIQSPPGLVTENYLLRKEGVNEYIKTIVNPRRVRCLHDSHHWFYEFKEWPVDEKKRPVLGSKSSPATAEVLRINHYHSKSLEDYKRKVARGAQDHTTNSVEIMAERDAQLNAVEDRTILRFVPELKRRLEARRREK